MNVPLSGELEKLVKKRIASGRYQSADDVIREGLRLLEERDRRQADLDEVRKKIAVGLEQLSRGECVPAEEAFERLREKSRQWRKKRA